MPESRHRRSIREDDETWEPLTPLIHFATGK
jgi:hypothetical protein